MEATLKRHLPPIKGQVESGVVNIAAYGPSLKNTWELIDDAPIISMSGSHDFLISRGKIPKYHIEQDPRPHKAVFTNKPHPDVHYLIGTCCSDELFNNFGPDNKVSVWNVLEPDPQIKEWIARNDPNGVGIQLGETVGVRAFDIALFLGFTKLRIFGLDCSWVDEQRAGSHNGDVHEPLTVGLGDGRHWKTSHELLLSARSFVNGCMNLIGKIEVEVYGDGFAGALLARAAQGELDRQQGAPMPEFGNVRVA